MAKNIVCVIELEEELKIIVVVPLLKKNNSEEGEEEGNINPIYKDLYNDDFPSLDAAMASTSKQEGSMEQRMTHPTIYQLDLQYFY